MPSLASVFKFNDFEGLIVWLSEFVRMQNISPIRIACKKGKKSHSNSTFSKPPPVKNNEFKPILQQFTANFV